MTIPLDNDETDGHLTTFMLDGQFELAQLEPGAARKIYVDGGEIELVSEKSYTVKGAYSVEIADEAGETPSLYLASVETEAGASFEDINVTNLPPAAAN